VFFSIIGAFYYLRVIKLMYFDNAEAASVPLTASTDLRIALSVNSLAVLGLGLFPGALLTVCSTVLG
jgi:NADH-quinone oxidoreductase subunit N